MTTSAAPRDSASKPRAPEPAKRSRQRLPARSWPSQLKSRSRTKSGVGRRPAAAGNRIRRLRHSPPMMRTALLPFVRTDDHGDEALRPHVPRERGADLHRGHALDRAREFREPSLRQAVEPDDRPLVEELAVRIDAQRKA